VGWEHRGRSVGRAARGAGAVRRGSKGVGSNGAEAGCKWAPAGTHRYCCVASTGLVAATPSSATALTDASAPLKEGQYIHRNRVPGGAGWGRGRAGSARVRRQQVPVEPAGRPWSGGGESKGVCTPGSRPSPPHHTQPPPPHPTPTPTPTNHGEDVADVGGAVLGVGGLVVALAAGHHQRRSEAVVRAKGWGGGGGAGGVRGGAGGRLERGLDEWWTAGGSDA
jgi:hypothetical protein